ncbi:putative sugar O-methyltransferase [Dermacoccaceae bacterium W4C1]
MKLRRRSSRQGSGDELTERTLKELESADALYRPTNFWGPGVEALLADMATRGLDSFKSWPTASTWFYPLYGDRWTNATMDAAFEKAQEIKPGSNKTLFLQGLNGSLSALRDFDVAAVGWDQRRWPFDLTGYGESTVGKPWQRFGHGTGEARFGRAYANYLLCLSALSRHVEAPPRSFLEIGGGFGVLGEIVGQRDPQARYVDLDIPPLLTVATYYLTQVLGEHRVTVYGPDSSAATSLRIPGCAALPNYRIADLDEEFEVFVNSYSFQEMEPDVVNHYIDQVCAKGIRYAVSLNSRLGKPKASAAGDWGAIDPVTSASIIERFGANGLELIGSYDAPYVRSQGQLNVFERR